MQTRFRLIPLFLTIVLFSSFTIVFSGSEKLTKNRERNEEAGSHSLYLPLINTRFSPQTPRINAPYFGDSLVSEESAIFWFGEVEWTINYADVRVGYTTDSLYVRIAVFDRQLWYDTSPSASDLTDWDSATLYLNLDDNTGGGLTEDAFAFTGQLNHFQDRSDYQAVYQGTTSGWQQVSIPFTTTTGWRGIGLNDNSGEDRGWNLIFLIPFESLGFSSGPPEDGATWRLGVALHDRDDQSEPPIPTQKWPTSMSDSSPSSWGQLSFGLPIFTPPTVEPAGTTTIRQGLNNSVVMDGMVGGSSICGEGMNSFWLEWGDANYAGEAFLNVQHQWDVADWPCFSKYYVTFPLDSLPANAQIISATLTMYHFGNAGSTNIPTSVIQVLTIEDEWDESTLTWNNAPLVMENVSRAWVEPLYQFPGHPGIPIDWDLSRAVTDAHSRNIPLQIALYSADNPQHTGKYFVSSDTGDWNEQGRPTLTVIWGLP